jgi:5-methylcytosine-specific restriction protein B
MPYGPATERQIAAVVAACERYGQSSIIALSGVPATGKSFVAAIAAQRHAGEPTRVKEIQFHPSFTYEEFVEGLRIGADGAVQPVDGVFLDWNQTAEDDGELRYVLLIEELTRANLSAVLGELLTYVEHRERQFTTLFSVAKKLTILATFNPVDRSAIDIDGALLRRLRIIDFPPDVDQLMEMLRGNEVPNHVITKIADVFKACNNQHETDFEWLMPFGHGIFAEVKSEGDLHSLWHQRLKRLLYRPLLDPHPFADTISAQYPWREAATFRLPVPVEPNAVPAAEALGDGSPRA